MRAGGRPGEHVLRRNNSLGSNNNHGAQKQRGDDGGDVGLAVAGDDVSRHRSSRRM